MIFYDEKAGEIQLRIQLPMLSPGRYSGKFEYQYYVARYLGTAFCSEGKIDFVFARFYVTIVSGENSTSEDLILLPSSAPSSGGFPLKILAFGMK